jgi:hypothetical protein
VSPISGQRQAEKIVHRRHVREERAERSGHVKSKSTEPEPVARPLDPESSSPCACDGHGRICLIHYEALRLADREVVQRQNGITYDPRWSGRWTPRRG